MTPGPTQCLLGALLLVSLTISACGSTSESDTSATTSATTSAITSPTTGSSTASGSSTDLHNCDLPLTCPLREVPRMSEVSECWEEPWAGEARALLASSERHGGAGCDEVRVLFLFLGDGRVVRQSRSFTCQTGISLSEQELCETEGCSPGISCGNNPSITNCQPLAPPMTCADVEAVLDGPHEPTGAAGATN